MLATQHYSYTALGGIPKETFRRSQFPFGENPFNFAQPCPAWKSFKPPCKTYLIARNLYRCNFSCIIVVTCNELLLNYRTSLCVFFAINNYGNFFSFSCTRKKGTHVELQSPFPFF
jgi:hypothetical protein